MKATETGHTKHPKLTKPNYGQFGKNEWAILGTKCNLIKDLSYKVIDRLQHKQIAYIDADHKSGDEPLLEHSAIASGGQYDLTDAIHYMNIKRKMHPNPFDYKQILGEQDIILVNGNHYQAKKQILIIDPNKIESVRKRLNQLTAVDLVISIGKTEVFDFVKEAIPHWSTIPLLEFNEVDRIAQHIEESVLNNIPKIKGLILAGGKSQRMGQDKGLINYHGSPQREYLYNLLSKKEIPTYLSCRASQKDELEEFKLITDRIEGLGPFGAIISAFISDPNAAWLVLACDLPFIDEQAIDDLIDNRNPSKVATCFFNQETKFPDPLFTIFEPKCYPRLYQFLSQGYSCPRKVLINSDTHVVKPNNPSWLKNVNTPIELEQIKTKLL